MTMSPVFMVFALIVASLCHSGVGSDKCSGTLSDNQMLSTVQCLAGYYKKGRCPNSKQLLCEKCEKEKYTEFNNTLLGCLPCYVCTADEDTKTECTNQRNRECECKDGLYRRPVHLSRSVCENCTRCRNCSTCPECKGNCGVQNCGQGQFMDQEGKCQSCADHSCLDKSCKSFCNPVPVPTTTWIIVLVIMLCILVLLGPLALFRCIFEACQKRQLYCWAQTKNVNGRHAVHTGVPPPIPILPGLPGDQPNIQLPLNIIPGSAVKDPGTRDKQRHLDSDWTGQVTAPLIINGDIKGIVTIFYN